MACCGKTKWAKDHKASNLDSHFNIIGTSSVVERAVKKATLGGEKTPRVYDSFLMKAGRFVEKMVELAPTRRRNYILDQVWKLDFKITRLKRFVVLYHLRANYCC